ncbi:MAG: TusE/DsrC/DsvC family sulfur relay protein [Gammaproteobacteria bacterium]|nr:TusE/DsrC/DsvC family sulfur relay protein [Gammaproteobacteria bacterium]MYD75681.1 TusE/DsrC/DsvC family sulfur relay protein [Gammaproteobacteria bacterium]MYJ51540.1 TusE/DsrC/DsvC family sulfur relay protein [Gammaproteobacteria bacterium]
MSKPDPDMFPHAPQGWDVDEALTRAGSLGIELTDDHWEVVAALQEYCSKHEVVNRRELVDALNEKFHIKGGTRFLYYLFPGGPVAQGCTVAGLEVPFGSVDRSFGSVV